MKAWIVNIGNEILIGRVVNTNATWLAQKLTKLGIEVNRIICIPDNEDDIISTIKEGIEKVDILITTGGLGPTFDDKTSESIAKALGLKWVINDEALREIEIKYKEKGMELTKHRIKMAMMPEGAKPLKNRVGTAPGILLNHKHTTIIALPGVPNEMKAIFEDHVEKLLIKIGGGKIFREDSIFIEGIPESSLAPIIEKVMKECKEVYIKSHPRGHEIKGPVIEIHVTAYGKSKDEANRNLRKAMEMLNKILSNKNLKNQ